MHLRVAIDISLEILVLAEHRFRDDVIVVHASDRDERRLRDVREPGDLERLLEILLASTACNSRAKNISAYFVLEIELHLHVRDGALRIPEE